MNQASPSTSISFNNLSIHINVSITVIQPESANNNSLVQKNTTFAVVGITVSSLLNVVQIKYQQQAASPFQTHPRTMTIAVSSLLLYCFGCDLENYVDSISHFSTWQLLVYESTLRFLAFSSAASFASIVFSTNSTSSVIVYMIFGLGFSARLIVMWIRNMKFSRNRRRYSFTNWQNALPLYHTVSATRFSS